MKESPQRYRANMLGDVLTAQGRRQDWLAAQAGVSRSLMSRIVSGDRTVGRDVADRIAGALQVPFHLAFVSLEREDVSQTRDSESAA